MRQMLFALLSVAALHAHADQTIGDPALKEFKLESLSVSSAQPLSEAEDKAMRQRIQRLVSSKQMKASVSQLMDHAGPTNAQIDADGRYLGRIRIGPQDNVIDFDDAFGPKNWGLTTSQGLAASRDPSGSIFSNRHIHDDVANKQAHNYISAIANTAATKVTGSSVLGTITGVAALWVHEQIPSRKGLKADNDPADMVGYTDVAVNDRVKVHFDFAMDGTGVATLTLLTGGKPRKPVDKPDWRKSYEGLSRGMGAGGIR